MIYTLITVSLTLAFAVILLLWRKNKKCGTISYAHRDYEECFTQTSAKDVLGKLKPLSKEEYDYYMNL
ncbi:MAG: hypothetical protein HQ536_04195 [Parcubacteria group bacterium]|nr:hypothetical protein [Parcubacteria group bacterium]